MLSRLVFILLVVTWRAQGEGAIKPPSQAGAKVDTRIFGGHDAPENSRPFQVSLRLVDVVRDTKRHICSGTIISKNYVLTAAHCVFDITVSRLLVIAGGNNLDGNGAWHYVKSVKIHEDYDEGFENDIALMKMRVPFEFGKSIAAIKLSSKSIPSNVVCEVSGWGVTNGYNYTQKLQLLKVKTTTFGDCYYAYQKFKGFTITRSHRCTYKEDAGICYGDGGDPLTLDNELIGVASYVVPCAKDYPDVFVAVRAYTDWIGRNMD